MKVRIRAVGALGLGVITAGLTAGLGAVVTPQAQAVLPGPDSSSWIPVKKAAAVMTDGASDFTTTHLDLTPAGGALGPATAFVGADLAHGSFRFHVAAAPASLPGGYVVQFDTDGNTAGWERALRFDPATGNVTIFTAGPNAALGAAGTLASTVPTTAATAATYPGADGGAYVAFAVTRTTLTAAGIALGSPMVFGTTSATGAGIFNGDGLFTPPSGDVLGASSRSIFGATAWSAVATDPLAIDSDGDGFADTADNCPVVANPGQEDDDKTLDNSLPPEPVQNIPDGTEGLGNACDPTPRGYDSDEDGVGYLDDQCIERPGVQDNGCPGHDATVATMRYNAKKKVFSGTVRGSVYDECGDRRGVSVLRVAPGADPVLKTVRSNSDGKFSIKVATKPKAGKYYVHVDPKNNFDIGLLCFADNSPKIDVR